MGKKFHSRKPFYTDDLDFTTNAPSYYEALARFIKALKALTERMDDVEARFKELVIGWLEDGTLADLLEQVLLDEYARIDWVQEQIKEVSDRLDKKFDDYKENIDKEIVNINNEINKIGGNLNELENIVNNHLDDYDTFYNLMINFRDKTNKKLEHFIINIDEFTGTDTQKIQSALNKARDLGGGTVYVPARTYTLTDELIIYKNTTLWSQDGTVFNRAHKGYMLMNGRRTDNFTRYNGNGNIKIINGVFDGKGQNDLGGVGSNIVLAHADGILIDNVSAINANSHNIEINSSKNVVIRNCKLLGQPSDLLYVEAIQLDLSTEGGFSGFGAFDNTVCKDVRIHDCYFGASKELPAVTRGIGTHATRIGTMFENVIIENNVFDGLRDFAIQFLCYKDSIIKNNLFKDCAGGVICYSSNPDNEAHAIDINNQVTTEVQPCSNIVISENTFKRINQKQVIYCYGRETSRNDNFKIIGNKIYNSLEVAGNIVAREVHHLDINDNIIYNVVQFPIAIRGASWVGINNNDIAYATTHTAIQGNQRLRYVTITNNKIFRCGGNGINLYDDVYTVVITGNLMIAVNTLQGEYNGIYCHSTGGKFSVCNNVIMAFSELKHDRAIYLTETITGGIMANNYADKGINEQKYLANGVTEVNNV